MANMTLATPLAAEDPRLDVCPLTRLKLRDAMPQHMHVTSRRVFIGPVPATWRAAQKAGRHRWLKEWHRWRDSGMYQLRFDSDPSLVRSEQPQPQQLRQSVDTGSARADLPAGQEGPASELQESNEPSQQDHSDSQSINGLAGFDDEASDSEGEAFNSSDDTSLQEILAEDAVVSDSSEQLTPDSGDSASTQSFTTARNNFGTNNEQPANGQFVDASLRRRRHASFAEQLERRHSAPPSILTSVDNDRMSARTEQHPQQEQPPRRRRRRSRGRSISGWRSQHVSGLDIDDSSDGTEEEGEEVTQEVGEAEVSKDHGLHRMQFPAKKQGGRIVHMQRVLARFENTRAASIPADFDETNVHWVDRHVVQDWREYILVARQRPSVLEPIVLYFHNNRRIGTTADHPQSRRYSARIVLNAATCGANLFSPLDKTIALWKRTKRGHSIIMLRAKGMANSIKWFGLLQNALGARSPSSFTISVPDLDVLLELSFATPDPKEDMPIANSERLFRVFENGKIVLNGQQITEKYLVDACLVALRGVPEWNDVYAQWLKSERLGLCWRKFDRLEWICDDHGTRLISQWTLAKTHYLELRPKTHYATRISPGLNGALETCEPPPVEGFLLKLTNRVGDIYSILGRHYVKHLYFTTHDNLLFFMKSKRARSPMPTSEVKRVAEALGSVDEALHTWPSSEDANIPTIFPVEPYCLSEDGNEFAWLEGAESDRALHDELAAAESARVREQVANADGFVDLTKVSRIEPVLCDTHEHERVEASFKCSSKENTLFSVYLSDEKHIILAAQSERTMLEWVKRLRDLVSYWKARQKRDMAEVLAVKHANMEILHFEDNSETYYASLRQKWAWKHCVANTNLFNCCIFSTCRTVAMKGYLFQKNRRRSSFKLRYAVLTATQLVLYDVFDRNAFGSSRQESYRERHRTIHLQDSYLLTGPVVSEFIHSNRSTPVDASAPGDHAIPRLYEDGLTSIEPDETLGMVIWTGRRKAILADSNRLSDGNKEQQQRGPSDGRHRRRLRSIARLGVVGRSVILMARSRLERDLWAGALGACVERLADADVISVVDEGGNITETRR